MENENIRDMIAVHALEGFLASGLPYESHEEKIALSKEAYLLADYMIAARGGMFGKGSIVNDKI